MSAPARAALPPPPQTRAGRREWLAAARPAALRARCGITLRVIAAALGVCPMTVWRWENGELAPNGAPGTAYCRVIAGLARHLEVTW